LAVSQQVEGIVDQNGIAVALPGLTVPAALEGSGTVGQDRLGGGLGAATQSRRDGTAKQAATSLRVQVIVTGGG
jgi:hypothetical protein